MKNFLTTFRYARQTGIEMLWLATILAIGVQTYVTNYNSTRPHGLMVRENSSGQGAYAGAIVKLVPLATAPLSASGKALESSPPPTHSVPRPSVLLNNAFDELGDRALTLPAARQWLSLSSVGESPDKIQGVEVVNALPVAVELPFE